MIGTVNQIAWALQIKAQVDAEFDRVRKVLESVATQAVPERWYRSSGHHPNPLRQTRGRDGKPPGRVFYPGVAGVAGSGPQVNFGNPRYKAIKANKAVRFMPPQTNTVSKDPPK